MAIITPVPKPPPREPKPKQGLQTKKALKRGSPLRQRSKSESHRRFEGSLRMAKEMAREFWGEECLVPVCGRRGTHLHHAYGRGSHPEYRASAWNLVPLCGGDGRHHNDADRADHWMHWACREVADEVRAHEDGRRPPVTRGEVAEIMRRYRDKAEGRHVSPMGAAD